MIPLIACQSVPTAVALPGEPFGQRHDLLHRQAWRGTATSPASRRAAVAVTAHLQLAMATAVPDGSWSTRSPPSHRWVPPDAAHRDLAGSWPCRPAAHRSAVRVDTSFADVLLRSGDPRRRATATGEPCRR